MSKKKMTSEGGYVLSGTPVASKKRYKHLTVEEADNGYVVSMWEEDKEIKVVCKDVQEVSKTINKIMKK